MTARPGSRRVIGFIGLGNMGSPMAANLAAAGLELVCFDTAGTTDRLPAGASEAAGVAEVAAAADTVLLSLPDAGAMLSVVTAMMASGARRVTTVIDLSTVGPIAAAQAAALLGPGGIAYVDGPVSGGVAGARARSISLMFSGPLAVLDAHREVLEAFTGKVFHVGTAPGQGQAMKLLNNYLSATALAATSEALSFGQRHGLGLAGMLDVLNASTGRNSATTDKFPNRVLTGTFDAGFSTALMAKDLRLYVETAERAGAPAAIGRSVSAVWHQADAAMPRSDFTRIWPFVSGEVGPETRDPDLELRSGEGELSR